MNLLNARQRTAADQSDRSDAASSSILSRVESDAGVDCTRIELGDCVRLALMITPRGRGAFREQALEALARLQTVLQQESARMVVTTQTVFLRDARGQAEFEQLLVSHVSDPLPLTQYVSQPPADGAALAIEVWAIGGESVRIERWPHTLAVSYGGARWIYCGGIEALETVAGVYGQTMETLERAQKLLADAGAGFERVVRTWFYLGNITAPDGPVQRYQELNRARSDFYGRVQFRTLRMNGSGRHDAFPASTGIGMSGTGLGLNCIALDVGNRDASLLPLENPRQTPAYAYQVHYSPQSPKFSRAMALVQGGRVTTWISGTASIVDSESRHPGDAVRQTEQTIDNIERLIAPENFGLHGVSGAGARLADMAKLRVYLKRPRDLAAIRAVCERRFGPMPVVYSIADICRPELLVEIEGIAFSNRSR